MRHELRAQLLAARFQTDELFRLLRPEALYERPIPERHRIVFYLGHLEAFDWNLICSGLFGMESAQKEFDRLFAFGIDPTDGQLPQDRPGDWPQEQEIHQYNARAREDVDMCLRRATDDQLFHVAIEHRFMHAETFAYMLHCLPLSMKHPRHASMDVDPTPVLPRQSEIPAGLATLGLSRGAGTFGWDNEFDCHEVQVPAFSIDKYKVTNAEYLKFVRAGGYAERSFWSPAAWRWLTESGTQHPPFWSSQGEEFSCRTMFADIPFQPSWPVHVSHAEAEAYARWVGKALPTEAQFHRAAYGTPQGVERPFPWGDALPQPQHGNFDFNRWDPARVDAYPEGHSAFGVADLVGNGWEWTSTRFAPFSGFTAFSFYPGYSADFFDGNHYVMKGGSSRTASVLLRRSFRNFFQPLFANIYAGFRCVET